MSASLADHTGGRPSRRSFWCSSWSVPARRHCAHMLRGRAPRSRQTLTGGGPGESWCNRPHASDAISSDRAAPRALAIDCFGRIEPSHVPKVPIQIDCASHQRFHLPTARSSFIAFDDAAIRCARRKRLLEQAADGSAMCAGGGRATRCTGYLDPGTIVLLIATERHHHNRYAMRQRFHRP